LISSFPAGFVAADREFDSFTVNGGSTAVVLTGAALTGSVQLDTDGSGEGGDWESSFWRISTTQNSGGTSGCDNDPNITGDTNNANDSLSMTAPATAGVYNAYVTAWSNNNCDAGGGESDTLTLTGAVVVVDSARTTAAATFNGTATTYVTSGGNVDIDVDGAITGGSNDWEGTSWLIATAPGAMTCENTSDNTSNGVHSESFTVSAPAAPGVYNAYLRINGSDTCAGGSEGTLLTVPNAVTVLADGRTTSSATLDGGSSVTVLQGASITAAILGLISDGNDWEGTQWLISTTSPGAMTCQNSTDRGSGSFTESFSITAPSVVGTYNAYFRVSGHDSCSNTLGSLLTMLNAVTVTLPDATPPTVTINQAVGQDDPTNNSTINFTVVFSESVSNFATGDVTLGGTAGATTAVVTGSGATYNVAVSGMTSDGTVTASLAAGVASDAATNLSVASTATDNTVTYDTTAPAAPLITLPTTDPFLTNDPGVALEGTAEADSVITVTGGTGTSVPSVTTTFGGSWSGIAAFLNLDAANNLSVFATDTAGNSSAAATITVNNDNTPPVLTVNTQTTNDTTPTVTGTTSDTADVSVTVDGILYVATPVAGNWSVTVSPIDLVGNPETTYSVSAASTDLAGNVGNGSGSVTIDTEAPALTLNSIAINATAITGTTDTSATVSVNINGTDYPANNVAGSWDVNVPGGLIGDDYTVTVTALDSFSNDAVQTGTLTIDTSSPTVTLSSTGIIGGFASSTPITIDIIFSDAVIDFILGDLSVSSGSLATLIGSGASYSAEFSAAGNGSVSIDLAAGVANEANGSGMTNAAAATLNFTFDATPPILVQVTPVPTPSTDTTPEYTFETSEAGTIAVGGSCSTSASVAVAGNNTVDLGILAVGTYNNCTVAVTDAAGNSSAALPVDYFTIEAPAAPTPTTSGGGGGGGGLIVGSAPTAPGNQTTNTGAAAGASTENTGTTGTDTTTTVTDTGLATGGADTGTPTVGNEGAEETGLIGGGEATEVPVVTNEDNASQAAAVVATGFTVPLWAWLAAFFAALFAFLYWLWNMFKKA
jgi:hypothetical protein